MASPNAIYRGGGDPDVAWLDIQGGLTLYVWHELTRVRGTIYITHEQGQQTVLWDGVIESAQADAVDSIRCVSVADQYFVVYWLDRDTGAGTYTLESRYVDMEGVDGGLSWSSNSTITVADAGLYDIKQIENPTATSEYMLVWAGNTTQCTVRRVDGPDHTTDVAWSTTITSNHAERVLAVHGDSSAGNNNGGVLVVYQDGDNDLRGHVLDFNDGTDVSSFDILAGTTREYAAVGIARGTIVAPSVRAAVIAEFQDSDIDAVLGFAVTNEDYVHAVVCREVNIGGTPAAFGGSHIAWNLNMMSKPYSYADAGSDRHVYCGLGFKSILAPGQWDQHVGFVCDMGFQDWGLASDTVRPRPVLTLNLANIDSDIHASNPEATARVSNGIGKRMNHLSNWIPGPRTVLCDTRKSRTVAWPAWNRLSSIVADELIFNDSGSPAETTYSRPVGMKIRGVIHYLEDPWTADRDDQDGGTPDANFHGANPLSLYDNTETAESLLVAGGTPQLYDGKTIVEAGFPWIPEIVSIADDPTGSQTGFDPGTWTYIAVYEWSDAKGQLHRSGHSRPISFENDGDDNPRLVIRTLNISNRDATWHYPFAAPIVIAIYRNRIATPNRYFRVHSGEASPNTPEEVPVNDPTAWAITFTDAILDDALEHAPELSFVADGAQQSELAPFQPPAAHLTANWKNRAWLISSENPKELWYSKENLASAALGKVAPEFHPFLIYRLDSIQGDVTGLQPMDDAMIVFTREGIYSLSGDGLDALAAGESSLSLQVLHDGTGCIEPRSIALTPAGIIFQSYKGMYLLDKSGQLDFISTGAPVEDLIRTAGNVRSGEHLPDRHLVAFVANGAVEDSPSVIKYDYYHRMWSTAELQPPNTDTWLSSTAAGCVWRGNERDASHVVLCQGGLLIERGKDDTTPYRDEDDGGAIEPILLDIRTGWIPLAGIMGYKRVREIGVQTEVVGTARDFYADIDVDIDGTFGTALQEVHTFTSPGGYVRVRPRTPKMSAFRLRLYEPSSVASSENRKINGIAVHIGRKKGPRKVADTQQG